MGGRLERRGRGARVNDGDRGFGIDALEPRILYSGSSHTLGCACGVCLGGVPDEFAHAPLTDVHAPAHAGTPLDLSKTFELHSLAGAAHTIYLDFDGHTTANTLWNQFSTDGSAFTTPAYSIDGDAAFSIAELTNIQHIWARVAEDFAPFQVNVTTQEPPLEALIRSGAGDATWGVRVVVGGAGTQWYGAAAGGVAWIGSFTWNSDTPVYVFEDNLGNGHEKFTAEAITHEVGHALGLGHDGTGDSSYYDGHGSGETGWAPIMGAAYHQNLTQWSRGQYSGANNREDDLAIITTRNGFGYRPDDRGDSLADAEPLAVRGGRVAATGIIERNTDVDVYSVTVAAGEVTFRIDPAARGPNLDVLAQLVDASGNILAAANPAASLGASITATVPAGTYYLRVSGGASSSGWYNSYASLGQYTVTGEVRAAAAAATPSLMINHVVSHEGNGWGRMAISLSEPSPTPVVVTWRTAPSTATTARDFYARAGQVTFAPGQTLRLIWVKLIDDAQSEPTERLMVGLADPRGASISRMWGSLQILDNEPGAAARRIAAAGSPASAASTPAPATAAIPWQLQQPRPAAAAPFAWSLRAAPGEADDAADDLLAQLPAVA